MADRYYGSDQGRFEQRYSPEERSPGPQPVDRRIGARVGNTPIHAKRLTKPSVGRFLATAIGNNTGGKKGKKLCIESS